MGFYWANAQIDPIFISTMPTQVDESSGLARTGPNSIWTHNDTDNDARIFNLDNSGNFLEQLELTGLNPVDFEDVCFDGLINFYVGDFGNNLNDRTDLKVYKIPNPDLLDISASPEVINFSLSDQSQFPPSGTQLNFDIEAMVYSNENLHLFSRNRTDPFNGLIKHYKLNPTPGTQVAELQGTYFGNLSENHSGITGADISQDGSRLVLLSNSALFTFTEFDADDFFGGIQTYNFFSENTSKEGITFVDNCNVRISEESYTNGDLGNFYSLNTCDIVSSIKTIDNSSSFQVVNSNSKLIINSIQPNFKADIYNISSQLIVSTSTKNGGLTIDLEGLPKAFYLLKLQTDNDLAGSFKVHHF